MIDKQWFLETYDRYVEDNGLDGVTLEKARVAVVNACVEAVESGVEERWENSLALDAAREFNRHVKPERDRRRSAIRKDCEHILAALADDTILGIDDPILRTAYPVGTGVDKTLFYWTREDFREATHERYRNAADVTAAAKEFDLEYAQRFITAMAHRQAAYLGELFEHPGDAA